MCPHEVDILVVGAFSGCQLPLNIGFRLGKMVACEHEAGEEEGKVFFHDGGGYCFWLLNI